jgi:NAD(P)-dependent dehydrogenase (short-subunit alcohol dehydrogenase family)
MKTIFITGSSAGLGNAVAKTFHANGWKVIATMRNPKNDKELQHLENVTLLPLDVTNNDQILSTVEQVMQSGTVDVVLNNAGYGLSGPLEAYPDEAIVEQIGTNLLGAIRITKAFIPFFKRQKHGLFINTTSIFGIITGPVGSVYNATKWGMEGWSESMFYELSLFNIGIKTVAPGLIRSNFINGLKAFSHPDYEDLNNKMYKVFLDGKILDWSDPELIAETVYQAATDGKDQLRYLAGEDAYKLDKLRTDLGNEGFRKHIHSLLNAEQ